MKKLVFRGAIRNSIKNRRVLPTVNTRQSQFAYECLNKTYLLTLRVWPTFRCVPMCQRLCVMWVWHHHSVWQQLKHYDVDNQFYEITRMCFCIVAFYIPRQINHNLFKQLTHIFKSEHLNEQTLLVRLWISEPVKRVRIVSSLSSVVNCHAHYEHAKRHTRIDFLRVVHINLMDGGHHSWTIP